MADQNFFGETLPASVAKLLAIADSQPLF